MDERERAATFLGFNYPELKDLGKHFLTISSATAVFVVTFIDKIVSKANRAASMNVLIVMCMCALLVSIISAGTGLFVNYVAGAGASGGIIWGVGKDYRRVTMVTYVLYLLAGVGLFTAYILLVATVIVAG